jgi:hypothetical protein
MDGVQDPWGGQEYRPRLGDLLIDMIEAYQQADRVICETSDPTDPTALAFGHRFHRIADMVETITGVDPRPSLEAYLDGR